MPITYYFRIMFYRSFYFVIDRGFFPPRRLERRCPRGRINILFLLCQTAVRALFFDVRSRVPSRFSRVMSAVESCSFRVSPSIRSASYDRVLYALTKRSRLTKSAVHVTDVVVFNVFRVTLICSPGLLLVYFSLNSRRLKKKKKINNFPTTESR